MLLWVKIRFAENFLVTLTSTAISCTNSSRPVLSNSYLCVHIQWSLMPSSRACLRPPPLATVASRLAQRFLLWSVTLLMYLFCPSNFCFHDFSRFIIFWIAQYVLKMSALCMGDSDTSSIDHLVTRKFVSGPSRYDLAIRGLCEQSVI